MKTTTSTFLILLSIAIFYTFTSPQYEKVKVLSAQAAEYEGVLDNLTQIAQTRDQLLISYESLPKDQLARLTKALPPDVDAVRVALNLDTIAAQYGISIKSIKVSLASQANTNEVLLPDYDQSYSKLTVSFSFSSSYPNFRSFLADLEKNLRIMNIQSTIFQAADTGPYEHQIVIETYWLQ